MICLSIIQTSVHIQPQEDENLADNTLLNRESIPKTDIETEPLLR